MKRVGFLCLVGASLVACGSPNNYRRSVHGTVGGYSMANVKPKPISAMVARKSMLPLYIVLDPAKVKDTWQIETQACAVGRRGCSRFKLMAFHHFVRRDLKAAMGHYFERVEVVDSPQALPKAPHVIGDVKVDDIRLKALSRGYLTYQLVQMTWGFAMRRSDQPDYAYSFAGTASSGDTYPTFEAGCAQLVENAIPAMLKKWLEKGSIRAFEKAGSAQPAKPAATPQPI